jgi:hypothetical protein
MEKLMYLLNNDAGGTLTQSAVRRLGEALAQRGASYIAINVTDLNDAVQAAAPSRIMGAWQSLAAVVEFWLDCIDTRADIEALLQAECDNIAGYLVTESVVQSFEYNWSSIRRPGVTQFTALNKPSDVSDEDFYRNWQGKHSASSFDLHPHRWSYIRNAVARPLTPNAPVYRALVLEHFYRLEDFTDDSIYFGSPEAIAEMVADVAGYCDVTTMISGPASEFVFEWD